MITKLRDPITQLIIALLGIVVTIIVFVFQIDSKELTYSIISRNKILNDIDAPELIIKFDDESISEAELISLHVKNTGDLSIIKDDFDGLFRIVFDDSLILDVNVVELNPKDIDLSFSVVSNTLIIDPLLINKDDEFIVNLLINKNDSMFHVESRIYGIEQENIQDLSDETQPKRILGIIFSSVLILFGIISLIVGINLIVNIVIGAKKILGIILIISGSILIITSGNIFIESIDYLITYGKYL